jgi:hypothetical protein
MTTHGDHWRNPWACRANLARDKRAANREWSKEYLKKQGITATEHNDGNHLIITHAGHTAEFWPGTGAYRFRFGGKYGELPDYVNGNGRGVEKLVLQFRKIEERR